MNGTIHVLTLNMPFGEGENLIHPVVLEDGENLVLVDCGCIGALAGIEDELARRGLRADRLTGLVLTHHDHDHMGAAAAMKRKYPAVTIYASAREEPYISAREKPLRLAQAEELQKILPSEQRAFGEAFCAMLRRVEPVKVDVALEDGDQWDWCGGCRVVATPGHTPGHIALFLPAHRTIIAGDAITLENGEPVLANPQFAFDPEKARASLDNLLGMGADAILCYHGGEYRP